MGQIFRLNPIGSALGPLANATLHNRAVQMAAGEDGRHRPPADPADVRPRPLPQVVRRHEVSPAAGRRGAVVLLDDCFTTYNNPEVGIAAVRVLEAAGYRVSLAGLRCCGRPAISKGLLKLGRDLARENVAKLLPLCPRRACRSSAASRAAW